MCDMVVLLLDLLYINIGDSLALLYGNFVEEFSFDEAQIINIFMHIIGFTKGRTKSSAILILEAFECDYMCPVTNDCISEIDDNDYVILDDYEDLEEFKCFNPKLLMMYGVKAIITDKGKWLYTCECQLDNTRLVLGSFAKLISRVSLSNIHGNVVYVLDDRLESVSSIFSHATRKYPVTVDRRAVTSKKLLEDIFYMSKVRSGRYIKWIV